MKALVKPKAEPGLSYIEVEKPTPKANEVVIEVKTASICGTDINYYAWNKSAQDFAAKFDLSFPLILGHEFAGIVVEVGKDVSRDLLGKRVSIETHIPCGNCYHCKNDMAHNCPKTIPYGTGCNGSFADYALADSRLVFELPDAISFEEGALLEPAGVAMRAIEEAHIVPGDTVVVNGCGPIGMMAVQLLYASGAGRVIALDMDTFRLEMAARFGAIPINIREKNALEEVLRLTQTRGGADVILEMSGASAAYETLFDMLRLEGRVVTVGHPGDPVSINIMKSINLKGAQLKGIFGRRIWQTWYNLTSLMAAKRVNLLDVVTHRFTFAQYEEAFAQIKKGAGKILFINE